MSTPLDRGDLRKALRFAKLWTTLNALVTVLVLLRIATAGLGRQPLGTVLIAGAFVVVVVAGLVRIRNLGRQLADVSA